MNQAAILAVALPLAIASYVALLPAVNLASTLTDRAAKREARARELLVEAALEHLRDLRVQLDRLFERYDHGDDPFLVSTQPAAVFTPVNQYVRLMTLQTAMTTALERARRAARASFWLLLAFAALTTISVAAALAVDVIGLWWSRGALIAAGAVFAAGALLFIIVLLALRKIDEGHIAAGDVAGDSPEDVAS